MITFTSPNIHFQEKWKKMVGDGAKVCLTRSILCLFFIITAFNSLTHAQTACAYNITLVSRTYNSSTNQTTFVWSVVNPNPGNGNNGTVQALSHWGFSINPCPNPNDALSEDDIVSAGYGSSSNPSTHSSLSVSIHDDNSQDCTGSTPILKFDQGTNGSTPTYYSLVLSGNWGTGTLNAYYKSGVRTGCGLCTIPGAGVGCRVQCPTITVTILPNLTQFQTNRTIGLSTNIVGGTGPFTYVWSTTTAGVTINNVTSATPTATVPVGTSTVTFNVTVNDVNGCPGSATTTLSQADLCVPPPIPILGTPAAICPGASTGIITVTNPQAGVIYQLLLGGSPIGSPVTYTSGTLSFTGLIAGSYTVRANIPNCDPVNSSVTVIANITVPQPTFGAIGTLCPGSTATLSATFPGGTTVTNIVWSGTGVSGNIFTAPATPGTYTVNFSATVNGCPVTGSLTIIVAAAPAPTFGTIGTLCPGATATLTATFPSGTTVSNIVWSGTGVTGNVFTAPSAGGSFTINFSATVNGCVVTGSFVINVASVPAPTFNTIGTLCPGATATLSATFPAGTTVTGITWSGTGVSGNIFTAPASPGTYTITFSATVNGCPVTATRTIVVATAPAPTFNTIGAICPGTGVTLVATFPAGTTVTNIVWSGTGVSGNTFTAPGTPGTYTVNFSATVNGCPVTGSLTIIVVAAASTNFTITVTGALCPGGGGSVVIGLSGSQLGVTYQLVLNGNNVGDPIPGTGGAISFGPQTAGGTYTVVATAVAITGAICVACPVTIGPITVSPAPLPTPTFTLPASVCPGATVPLTATFPAGTTVTGIVWSGTGVSGSTFTAPAAGGNYVITFSATVNGCPFTTTVTITVANVPAPTFASIGTLCPGATATLSATFPAGTTVTNIVWSGTGVSGNIFTAPSTPGTYTVNFSATVNGCPLTASLTITVATVPPPVFGTIGNLCPGATATLSATFPAGTTVTNIVWSGTGVSGNSFTAPSTPGTYTVNFSATVNGCPVSGSFTITVVAAPSPVFVTIGPLCPGAIATLVANFPAGTTVTNIVWSGTGVSGTQFTAPSTPGTYTVNFSATVNGCPVAASLTITVIATPAPTFGAIGPLCPGATATLSATFPAGTTVTNIVWSGTGVSGNTFTAPSTPGTYTVNFSATVNGCPVTASLTITVVATPAPTFGTISPLCPGATATLSATFPAGTTVTNIVWSGTGVSGNTFTAPSTPGTYTVNFSALVNGCPVTGSFTITVIATPAPTFGTISPLCPGATATLTATFPAGTTVTNIVWSGTGVSGNIFTAPSTPGTYTVNFSATVNGCPVTGSFTITVVATPSPTFATIGPLCPGASATLSATFPAGTTVTNIVWSGTGVSGNTFTAPSTPGTYTVNFSATVNGCPVTASLTITVVNVPAPTFSAVGPLCPGATATLTATFPAGTTVTNIVWSGTGVSGNTFTAPSTPGSYIVTFSANANGCAVAGSITIVVNPVPAALTVVGNDFCPGGAGTIVVQNIEAGVSYQVRVVGGSNVGAAQTGSAGSNLTFTNIPAGTYQIVATNTAGCVTVFGNVTIAQVVVTPCVITGPTSVCMGTTNTYTVSTGPGVTNIQWSVQGGNCIIVGTSSAPTVTIKAIGPGTFIVRATVSYGNCTTTCELTVTSTPLAVSAPNITVCPNTITPLVGNPTGGVWASSNPLIQAGINNTNSTFNSAGIPAGNYPVTYTVTQADGCTGTALGSITVFSTGVIGRLSGASVSFPDKGIEIKMDKSTVGVTYQLMRNGVKVGSPIQGTGGEINFGVHELVGDYSVTATNRVGDCSASGRVAQMDVTSIDRIDDLRVQAYPNPYSDRIRFTITSDRSGPGVLEVYDLGGARIKTVFKGDVTAGKMITVDFGVPGTQRINMIYKMRVGDLETTGKLINIK